MKTTTNPHAWFYAYLKGVEGYKQYGNVIKEAIVSEYSGGKTESLSELYNNYRIQYEKMKGELTGKPLQRGKITFNPELDRARKRLIALLFDVTGLQGYKKGIDYIKNMACIAAKEKRFNDIPLKKLNELYQKFGRKKEPLVGNWVDGVLNEISREV